MGATGRVCHGCGRRIGTALLAAAALLVTAAISRADELRLQDGRVLDGRIVSENEREVKIELLGGTVLSLPRKSVVAITKGKSLAERIDERLAALHPALPAEYEACGLQCLEQKPLLDVGRRCLLIAAALLPERYAQLEAQVGESYLGTKDKALATHHFRRALLADPTNESARARLEGVAPEDRGAAGNDPYYAPGARMPAARRRPRSGDRIPDPDVAAGQVVWHDGRWMSIPEKRRALGEKAPPDPDPPGWDQVAAATLLVPADAPADALARMLAAWSAGTPPAGASPDAVRLVRFSRAPSGGAGEDPAAWPAGNGPLWRASPRGLELILYAETGESTRAFGSMSGPDSLFFPAPLGFDLSAAPAQSEVTAFVRVRDVQVWYERLRGHDIVRNVLVVEPIGFELKSAPGGPVLLRWR